VVRHISVAHYGNGILPHVLRCSTPLIDPWMLNVCSRSIDATDLLSVQVTSLQYTTNRDERVQGDVGGIPDANILFYQLITDNIEYHGWYLDVHLGSKAAANRAASGSRST
jgi:hypothetical protein